MIRLLCDAKETVKETVLVRPHNAPVDRETTRSGERVH